MNKIAKASFVLLLCTVILLLGCYQPLPPPNTKWVSKDPDIYFQVASDLTATGVVQTENGKINITIGLGAGIGIWKTPDPGKISTSDDDLLTGSYELYKNKMVMEVGDDYLFGGKYKTIEFDRVE